MQPFYLQNMYMKKYKLLSTLLIALLCCLSKVDAVRVRVIKWKFWSNPDVSDTSRVYWKYSIFDLISFANWYLWFAIWFVCFLFMIWNWYQLIIARGDEKQMKSSTAALTWCAIWLVVCILAYIIVNIAIKLFA